MQNNREQIELSKKLALIDTNAPIDWTLDAMAAQQPDNAALKVIYKEMEFFSLLRELGPSDDTRARDYQRLETSDEIRAYFAEIPQGAPIAMATVPASLLEGVQDRKSVV